MLMILVVFIERRRDRSLQREELETRNRRLRLDRLTEDFTDPGKRIQVIEDKIVRKAEFHSNEKGNNTEEEDTTSVTTEGTEGSIARSSASSTSDEEMGVQMETSDMDSGTNSTDTENLCSVCLEPFLEGEEVAWSRQLTCNHCFHSSCLITWLMKHEDCPVCRAIFMNMNDFEDTTTCGGRSNGLESTNHQHHPSVTTIDRSRLSSRSSFCKETEQGADIESSFIITNGQVVELHDGRGGGDTADFLPKSSKGVHAKYR